MWGSVIGRENRRNGTLPAVQPEPATTPPLDPASIAARMGRFRAHRLDELGDAALMRRFDRKFVLAVSHLPALLDALQADYTALEIEDRRVFRYESLYFDTPTMEFFRMHHRGQLNRYKVRHRVYADTDTRFLEVKFKDNRRQTEKTRIPTDDRPGELHGEGLAFLDQSVPDAFNDLRPALRCRFRRIALANLETCERVTLDFDLAFGLPDGAPARSLSRVLVVELKQPRRSADSPVWRVMRRLGVRPQAFSKYCIGCCLVDRGGKANRFKRALARVRAIGEAS